MIAKSEFSEVISDVVLLLEKQIPDFTRKDITDFLEVLNSSDDEKLPVIVLGKNGQLLFKDVETKTTRLITKEAVQEILDYDEFLKSGNIMLRKAS
ncbi:MAG: hypothetical protein MJ181_11690 [Treponema sp.]|nr:hypothetical protein [Treponema sp.]MCQ2598495.1 hypothetical protein [Treponema sp.]